MGVTRYAVTYMALRNIALRHHTHARREHEGIARIRQVNLGLEHCGVFARVISTRGEWNHAPLGRRTC